MSTTRPHHLLALTGLLALTLCAQPAAAQQPVGIDGVPEAFNQIIAQQSGDVLVVAPPKQQQRGRPMSRVLITGDTYQIDPIIFGNPNWASLRVDDAAEAPDQTLWAIGDDSVVFREIGGSWQMIEMPELNRSGCAKWTSTGVPCQMIIPVAQEQAVVLRPRYQSGRLSTEVYAIQQGERRPLGSVVLPGVALGPAVQDGEGGFWVMLRRTERTSNYKPMRGYLHYTSRGEWLMWSDSGEVVEGTQLEGRAAFLIDPSSRKMAPDGQGGFYAIGRDRVIYHVDAAGAARRFSKDQPACNYCQPMTLDYDATAKQLHLLLSEWREGEGGKIEVMGATRWLRFEGSSGKLQADEEVPLPQQALARARQLFDSVRIAAEANGVWVAAPDMLLHRDAKGWFWLTQVSSAQRELATRQVNTQLAESNPASAQLAGLAHISMAAAGGLGAVGVAMVRKSRRSKLLLNEKPGVLTSTPGYISAAVWGFGGLTAWYPANFMYDGLYSQVPGVRGLRLIGGGLVTTLLTGGVVWLTGEAFAGSSEGSEAFTGSGRAAAGAFGGAALGTVGSLALMRMFTQNSPATEANTFALQKLVGAAAISGISTLFYVAVSEKWQTEYDPGPGSSSSTVPLMTTFSF